MRHLKLYRDERYSLDAKTVGEGAFGRVHGATCRITGQRVAVKTVEKVEEAGLLRMLLREIIILQHLPHPNLLQVLHAPHGRAPRAPNRSARPPLPTARAAPRATHAE